MVNHQSKNQSKREDIENIIPSNPKKKSSMYYSLFLFLIKTSLGSNLGDLALITGVIIGNYLMA